MKNIQMFNNKRFIPEAGLILMFLAFSPRYVDVRIKPSIPFFFIIHQ